MRMLRKIRKSLDSLVSYPNVRRLAMILTPIIYLTAYSISPAISKDDSLKTRRDPDYEAIVKRVKSSTDSVIVRILEGEVSDPIGSNELWFETERELATFHVIKSPYLQGYGRQGYVNVTVVPYEDGDILLTRFWRSRFTINPKLEGGYVKGDVEESLLIVDGGKFPIDGEPENVYVIGRKIGSLVFSESPPRLLEGYRSNPETKDAVIEEYKSALDGIKFLESKK